MNNPIHEIKMDIFALRNNYLKLRLFQEGHRWGHKEDGTDLPHSTSHDTHKSQFTTLELPELIKNNYDKMLHF